MCNAMRLKYVSTFSVQAISHFKTKHHTNTKKNTTWYYYLTKSRIFLLTF